MRQRLLMAMVRESLPGVSSSRERKLPDASFFFVLEVVEIPHHGRLFVTAGSHGAGGDSGGVAEAEGEVGPASHFGGDGEEQDKGGKRGDDGEAGDFFVPQSHEGSRQDGEGEHHSAKKGDEEGEVERFFATGDLGEADDDEEEAEHCGENEGEVAHEAAETFERDCLVGR